jgi:hypothetical protein
MFIIEMNRALVDQLASAVFQGVPESDAVADAFIADNTHD